MIYLAYSLNNDTFDGILTSLLSIFRRSVKDIYTIYLLSVNDKYIHEVDPKKLYYLEKMVQEHGDKNSVIKVDITSQYMQLFKEDDSYIDKSFLFLDKIDELPDKVLYLDADTLFTQDIHTLYNQDILNSDIAACSHQKAFRKRIDTGVLLFNLKRCRQNHSLEKLRKQFLHPFMHQRNYFYPNLKIKRLPQKFNEQKKIHHDTIVKHFVKKLFLLPYPHKEDIKPYHVELVHSKYHYHQFDDIYVAYSLLKLQIDSTSYTI